MLVRVRILSTVAIPNPDGTISIYNHGQVLDLNPELANALVASLIAELVPSPGDQMIIDQVMSDTSKNPVANQTIKSYVDNKTDLIFCAGTATGIQIPAHTRRLVEIPINLPEGYEIHSYRAIAISGAGRDQTCLQYFSTAKNGTVAQTPLINISDQPATVDVNAVCLARRRGSILG